MDDAEFNGSVLATMPHYIATTYQKLLQSANTQDRVMIILHLYRLILRTLTITVVSQYLIRDRETVQDAQLSDLLLDRFPKKMDLAAWQEVLFTSLQVYGGHKNLLFMPELYDLYWDTSAPRPQPRRQIEVLFSRLTAQSYEEPPFQDTAKWQELEAELIAPCRQLLEEVSFLQEYDLIRVVDYDDESYDFELYKGLAITQARELLPQFSKLSRGWFYIRNPMHELLLLHPLLIFWDQTEDALLHPDTGLYNRFTSDRLQYLLTSPGSVVDDERSRNVQAFISLVYDTIENFKSSRQETEQLTWLQLLHLAADITQQRITTVQHKYDEALYLQRAKVHEEFVKFLQSDKRGFVLIGKSGVGKSNFLVAMNNELTASRIDVSFLMYDGTQVSEGTSISTLVTQDFNNRLVIGGKRIEDIWQEIARIDGIRDRVVVLCVDAINETAQAKDLLRQLDDLVLAPWPWLKVVVSCRPETWQSIRRSVSLAEGLYYTEPGSGSLEVSLEPFSYSERLEPFSRGELQEAYAKYAQQYGLQTEFAQLSAEVREVLREPLNLWLVANTYPDQQIPNTIRVTDLVGKFVDGLLKSKRLYPEDLRLLEKRLVPLMASPGHFSNVLTSDDLDIGGTDLYETLYSTHILSDGQRVNQSFTNLVDAEILVQQAGWREQRIGFKYERFYEFFVGQRILEMSTSHPDREEYFSSLAALIASKPYLWGAVRTAIVADAAAHGTEILVNLCRTDKQRVKELMVDALTSIGADQPEQVDMIMRTLLPPAKKRSSFRRIRQLAAKQTLTSDPRTRNARKIAIEVASNLELPGVLRVAALHVDSTTRTWAVRYAYQLWRRNQEIGYDLLDKIADDATPGLIPDSAALESFLGLSLIIFFDHLHDTVALKKLQVIWHDAIGRLLGIDQSASRLSKWLRDGIRQRLYDVAVSLAFRLLHDFGEFNPISLARVEAFFRLPFEQKQLYRRLVDYLDVDRAYPRADVERDYLVALRIRNFVVEAVAELGISARLRRDPGDFLPFIKQMFTEVENDPVPSAWRNNLTYCLTSALDKDPSLDEVFDFFMYAMERCQTYYSEGDNRKASSTSDSPDAEFLGHYIVAQYERAGTVQTPWLMQRIESARERQSADFFKSLIESHLPQAGIEKRKPQAALDALSLVLHFNDAEITKMACTYLAHLRTYYPDEVDAFLEDEQMPEDFRLIVRTSEPGETVGELIGFRVYDFLLNDVILSSPELRTQFSDILATAAVCSRMREWVDYLIPEVVNRVYGGTALRT